MEDDAIIRGVTAGWEVEIFTEQWMLLRPRGQLESLKSSFSYRAHYVVTSTF